MKRLAHLVLALALCGSASTPAAAVLCAVDQVPAATLLVPFFEVDIDDFNSTTTLVEIMETSGAAVLTHWTLWTDWGIPALTFDVYLTGHDVQTVNVRDLLNGNLPRTASTGQDPGNFISPRGPRSTDVNYPSCNGVLPPTNPMPALLVDEMRRRLTGKPLVLDPYAGKCAGSPRANGDNIARGYITIDVVNGCTLLDPTEPSYYTGTLGNANVLIGDAFLASPGPSFNTAYGYPVVHLEAATLPPGSRSFYGRYVGGTGSDGREPLPSTFVAPFDGPSPDATQLMIWRESGAADTPVDCGTQPAWAPLPTKPIELLDEQTQEVKASLSLPIATDIVDLAADVTNPFGRGLAVLDLDHGGFAGRPAQAFVWRRSSLGSVGPLETAVAATPLEDLCTGSRFFLMFHDGFEQALAPWSGVTP